MRRTPTKLDWLAIWLISFVAALQSDRAGAQTPDPPALFDVAQLDELLTCSDGGPQSQFGSSIAASGDVAVVAAANFLVNYAPKVFVFERTDGTWRRTAQLHGSQADDLLEGVVAIDGETIVVAGRRSPSPFITRGLFLFTRPAGGWQNMTETAFLTPTGGDAGDLFGASVCIHGDTVAAGAPGASNGVPGHQSGVVYVFERPKEGWRDTAQRAKLTAGSPVISLEQLGQAVAIDDGVIVASGRNTSGQGRVFVFERPPGGWRDAIADAVLTGTGSPLAGVGAHVAIEGDVAVAGAENDFAYVWVRGKAHWQSMTQTARLRAKGSPIDAVDSVVAISDSVIFVGAQHADNGVFQSEFGAVYVFVEPPTGWADMSQTAKLTVAAPVAGDEFGERLACAGQTLLVGTPHADGPPGFSDVGRVYVFDPPATGWSNMHEDIAIELDTTGDLSQGDEFATSLAIDGDTAIVAAPLDQGVVINQGSVFVFERVNGRWMRIAKLTSSTPATSQTFGTSVAISHDTVIVGRAGQQNNPVFLFVKPATGWADMTESARLTVVDPNAFGTGNSLAIDNETIVVGAPISNGGGAAYVFVRPAGGWVNSPQTAKLTASDHVPFDRFGYAVSVHGNTIAVGAYLADNGAAGTERGATYVFESHGGWSNMTETAKLTPSDPGENSRFGNTVAVRGDTVIVGAYLHPNPPGLGVAYVYERPRAGWVSATESARLTPLAPQGFAAQHFARTVALTDTVALVGASWDFFQNGTGFVYVKPSSGWTTMTETARLQHVPNGVDDVFGSPAAISGATALVGARLADGEAGGNQGAAYVYDLNLGDCNGNGVPDLADISSGLSPDLNNNGIPDECESPTCPGNIISTGTSANRVDVDDLLAVISQWGPCPTPPALCQANIVNTGTSADRVDVDDLLAVISGWGACP